MVHHQSRMREPKDRRKSDSDMRGRPTTFLANRHKEAGESSGATRNRLTPQALKRMFCAPVTRVAATVALSLVLNVTYGVSVVVSETMMRVKPGAGQPHGGRQHADIGPYSVPKSHNYTASSTLCKL